VEDDHVIGWMCKYRPQGQILSLPILILVRLDHICTHADATRVAVLLFNFERRTNHRDTESTELGKRLKSHSDLRGSVTLWRVQKSQVFGDRSGGETPVPIPNTEVKPTSADGTNLVTSWESRSLPRLIRKSRPVRVGFFIP
jgi:hypothetical protein